MSYVVFDLDETLAHLTDMYYFIASLKLKDIVMEQRSYMAQFFPEELFEEQERAYQLFVKHVWEQETSERPLGILRPGVLDIMKRLYKLKRKGKVAHVIIYSNNGYLQNLEFVRDIIHMHVGSNTLITDCIHRTHPLRLFEAHTLAKSWGILRSILIQGQCNALEHVSPKDVYFFDDMNHTDLHAHLAEQYYHVPPYTFSAAFSRVSELYASAVNEADVDVSTFLINIIDLLHIGDRSHFFDITETNVYDIIYLLDDAIQDSGRTTDVPPPPDQGYRMMMDAVEEIKYRTKRKRNYTLRKRRITVRKS